MHGACHVLRISAVVDDPDRSMVVGALSPSFECHILLWMFTPLVRTAILDPVRLEYLMARKPEQWEMLEYWYHRCSVAAPEAWTPRFGPRWPLVPSEGQAPEQ